MRNPKQKSHPYFILYTCNYSTIKRTIIFFRQAIFSYTFFLIKNFTCSNILTVYCLMNIFRQFPIFTCLHRKNLLYFRIMLQYNFLLSSKYNVMLNCIVQEQFVKIALTMSQSVLFLFTFLIFVNKKRQSIFIIQ